MCVTSPMPLGLNNILDDDEDGDVEEMARFWKCST